MDKYGLIGYPLGHSFSRNYFNEKFENEGIDAKYINFEIPHIEDLTEILDTTPELKGLNVTIPYKEKVISYLDFISPEATAIGAVNVIKVEHKGNDVKLKGYNSDVIGFTRSIEPFLEPCHKKALILGTGGASKAINYGLKSLGLETVYVSRFERPGTIQYDKITPEIIKEYNVIVNCTPCRNVSTYRRMSRTSLRGYGQPHPALRSHLQPRRDPLHEERQRARSHREERFGNVASASLCIVGLLASGITSTLCRQYIIQNYFLFISIDYEQQQIYDARCECRQGRCA